MGLRSMDYTNGSTSRMNDSQHLRSVVACGALIAALRNVTWPWAATCTRGFTDGAPPRLHSIQFGLLV